MFILMCTIIENITALLHIESLQTAETALQNKRKSHFRYSKTHYFHYKDGSIFNLLPHKRSLLVTTSAYIISTRKTTDCFFSGELYAVIQNKCS